MLTPGVSIDAEFGGTLLSTSFFFRSCSLLFSNHKAGANRHCSRTASRPRHWRGHGWGSRRGGGGGHATRTVSLLVLRPSTTSKSSPSQSQTARSSDRYAAKFAIYTNL